MKDDARGRRIVWFSRGAASAVAWLLTKRKHPDCIAVHCATNAEHPDSDRFEREWCEVMGAGVIKLQSEVYKDTWDVWETTRWLAGIKGARCTGELKIAPRVAFQHPTDIHVFGYTADAEDVKRAERLRANYFEMRIETPLIDAGLTKQAVLAMVQSREVELPEMYKLGYQNNNCIPCVKATSPDYWALVRKTHPEEFDRMVKLSRELNVRLCRIKGERAFIDEIPADWPTTNPIVPACDFLCQIEDQPDV
jgi:3'-phosphoadenosine 5'-phosphosulfate sulfotransferase (PAPS reductase)/FAD synthetase